MGRTINVLEHQRVELPALLDNGRTKLQLFRAGQTELGPALKLDGRKLTTSGLVGLVSTSKVQIQILPKIYDTDSDSVSKGLKFLHATFPMALGRRFGIQQASTARSSANLLDVVLSFFLRRLAELLEWDFPREYFEVNELRDTITGRVDFVLVIAEGVETLEQYQWLADNGCQLIQGYLVARPMLADEALSFPKVFDWESLKHH